MSDIFPLSGSLAERSVPSIFFAMYKQFIDGTLLINAGDCRKKFSVFNRKVMFASSSLVSDSFGAYLLKNRLIDDDKLQSAEQYRIERQVRLGRALLELGFLEADDLWRWIKNHLKEIVFSTFSIKEGEYEILADCTPEDENILLDADIPLLLVEGMRNLEAGEYIDLKSEEIDKFYIYNVDLVSKLELRPYERHILDLVRKNTTVKGIIEKSELLEPDTWRILNLFLILEIISTEEPTEKRVDPEDEKNVIPCGTFASFEEALRHYSSKYELIFRTLSKEIGPIAHSILSKAIANIVGSLPSFLRKVQLETDGSLRKDIIIKSLWYHDFDTYIGEFLRGLEEILYAEIYAVKEHLGVEYEQQILRWINQLGN